MYRGITGERQGGQARTAPNRTHRDDARPDGARRSEAEWGTPKPGRGRANRNGGPKAHTAEQERGTGESPSEAIWRQGKGTEAQARKAPKRTAPPRPGLSPPPSAPPRHDRPHLRDRGAGPPRRRHDSTRAGTGGAEGRGGGKGLRGRYRIRRCVDCHFRSVGQHDVPRL